MTGRLDSRRGLMSIMRRGVGISMGARLVIFNCTYVIGYDIVLHTRALTSPAAFP